MSLQRVRLELDSNTRRISNGTALIGGTPFRLMRLTPTGARCVDAWLRGAASDDDVEGPEATALRDRLLAAGMMHPVPEGDEAAPLIGFVIPVHDDVEGLAQVLSSVRRSHTDAEIVVVDDASEPQAATAIANCAAAHRARLVRHAVNLGPGAARNTGWRLLVGDDRNASPRAVGSEIGGDSPTAAPAAVLPEVVAFIDADIVLGTGALDLLAAHFVDPNLAVVAPRVRARPGLGFIDRYESTESPLDLGVAPALVRPRGRVPYLPTAAIAVRVDALVSSRGFDESVRVGEDVDWIFRLLADGHLVRFEPRAVAHHRNRSSLTAMFGQRHGYGTSAAPLAARHGSDLAPVELPAATMAAWGLIAFGGRRLRTVGLLIAVGDAVNLGRKLGPSLDRPVVDVVRLSLWGHSNSVHWLCRAVTRAWAPAAIALCSTSRRARRVSAVAVLTPPVVTWLRTRPPLDPIRYVALRVCDDLAYCTGVWAGAMNERSAAALAPKVVLSATARSAAQRLLRRAARTAGPR